MLTVPEVVAEVRNKRQIRRLCVLPFDLQVREPRPESVKHCVEFAKKTGDYASLSGIDLKVIALTYELEADILGTEHLRSEPVVSQVIASKEKPEEMQDVNNKRLVGWYMPEGNEDDETDDSEEEPDNGAEDEEDAQTKSNECSDNVDHIKAAIEAQLRGEQIQKSNIKSIDAEKNDSVDDKDEDEDDLTQEELDKLFEKLKCAPSEDEDQVTSDILVALPTENVESDDELEAQQQNVDDDEDVGDDGWITHSNIKRPKSHWRVK